MGNKKNVHDGHRDRIRQRYLRAGINSFNEHEILEFLLFYALSRGDTNVLAHALIDKFGSLAGVFNAPIAALQEVKGIGESCAILIKLVQDVFKSDFMYLNDLVKLDTTDKLGNYLLPMFKGERHEIVIALALDAKMRVINTEKLAEGESESTSVPVSKIVRFLIANKSSCAVLAHNHPNGIALPSVEDLNATTRLKKTLDGVGIRLHDHIIVADKDFVSLRDSTNKLYSTTD